jgi:drug/metabolite transporter (DMT)-like permease
MTAAPTENNQINQAMTAWQWAMLLVLSVLWGGSFFFIGVAVKELPPLTVVAARLVIAAMALYAVVRFTGTAMPRGLRVWQGFAWLGLLNNVLPFSLFAWGQTHISGGLASILNATTPLFTVLVAHILTRDEKMTPGHLIGAIIGLAGVAAMIGNDAGSVFGAHVVAQLACLGASISYAYAGVYGRRFSGIPPLAAATAQLVASAVLMVPVVLVVDQPWALPAPSWATVAAILSQSLLSTALAFVLFFHILATAGATNVALVTFLNPMTAIVLGAAFLGERLEAAHVAGMAVIGIGLAFIDGRLLKRLRRKFAA